MLDQACLWKAGLDVLYLCDSNIGVKKKVSTDWNFDFTNWDKVLILTIHIEEEIKVEYSDKNFNIFKRLLHQILDEMIAALWLNKQQKIW